MQVGERQVFDHAARGFELGVGLAGESDHHVGADRGGGHGGANLFDLLAIVPRTIFAMHAPQHRVAAGLHGHVRMLGDARRRGDQRRSVRRSSPSARRRRCGVFRARSRQEWRG